jgi:hypothetical protein
VENAVFFPMAHPTKIVENNREICAASYRYPCLSITFTYAVSTNFQQWEEIEKVRMGSNPS